VGSGAEFVGVEAVSETRDFSKVATFGPRMRAISAFLIAPIAPSLVFLFLSPAYGVVALEFSALMGYPIAVVVGLPIFFLSKPRGWTGLRSYALFALLCALILVTTWMLLPWLSQGRGLAEILGYEAVWGQMALATLLTFFSVGVFWLIARPDRG